jgi:membrane fusion protein (multidrug efflux system)
MVNESDSIDADDGSQTKDQARSESNAIPPAMVMRHGRRRTDPVYRTLKENSPDGSENGNEGESKAGEEDGKANAHASDGQSQVADKEGDDKDAEQSKDGGDKQKDEKKPRSKLPLIILAVVILILAVVGFFWWFATRNQVSTDDAFTDGNAVVLSPIVSGYVVSLRVNDNVYVHKGDVLVQIDARDYVATRDDAAAQVGLAQAQLESAKIALEMARVQYPAQMAQAEAQEKSSLATLRQAQSSYDRQHSVDRRATTEENIDTANSQQVAAKAGVESARAQLKVAALVGEQLRQAQNKVTQGESQLRQAQAKLAAAELNVGYCQIVAPSDGWITKRNVQFGSFLAAGTPMFTLVTPELWVTANFKESQLERMRPGDAVTIEVDAYPNLELHGHVDSVQLGSGSRFAAFPTENATGNFVKIVQRVPVKIVIDRGLDSRQPLPLGLSVLPVVMLR